MKTKVFHIVPTKKTGGVENAAESARQKLNESFKFSLIYLNHHHDNNFFGLGRGIVKAIKILKKEQNFFLISSLWKSVFIPLILKFIYGKSFKWIHIIHSAHFFSFIDSILNIVAIRLCDSVFADSHTSMKKRKNLTKKEIKCISFKLFPSTSYKKKNLTQELKIVFIGRLDKVKNLSFAIKIIEEIYLSGYSLIFDIYGPKENDYKNLSSIVKSKKLGHIIQFKKELKKEEIITTLDKYQFFIQTSHREGMAMTVVEAMMCGLVCLVTPVGEISNYSQDMLSAIHINPRDEIDEFINKFNKVVEDQCLYNQISLNAHKVFRDNLTYAESLNNNLLVLE